MNWKDIVVYEYYAWILMHCKSNDSLLYDKSFNWKVFRNKLVFGQTCYWVNVN